MRINNQSNAETLSLSPLQTNKVAASVENRTFETDVVESSSQHLLSDQTASGRYNLHSITHDQLLNVIEGGQLSPGGKISISADGSWKAAPGASFSSALFTMAEPPRVDGGASNGSDIQGTMDLFQGVQNQMGFDKSIGDTSGAARYQALLNTIQAATDAAGDVAGKS